MQRLIAVLIFSAAVFSACNNNVIEDNTMSKIIEENGIALKGFDAVSYFEGSPKKGSTEFSHQYSGLEWHFSNRDHLTKFSENPQHYLPQYGGHCAFAMSLGETSPGNPQSWHIEDGKLYFNGNGFAKLLFKIIPGRQAKADSNWKTTESKLSSG